jgi:hypothetical protein
VLFNSYNDRPPRWAPLVSGFGMAGKKLLTQPDFPLRSQQQFIFLLTTIQSAGVLYRVGRAHVGITKIIVAGYFELSK